MNSAAFNFLGVRMLYKTKEPEKTVKKQPINDLDTALSMVKDAVSNTEDIEAVKRRTLIMIDMIRERYCGC